MLLANTNIINYKIIGNKQWVNCVALNGHPGACNKQSFIASSTQNENLFCLLIQ